MVEREKRKENIEEKYEDGERERERNDVRWN